MNFDQPTNGDGGLNLPNSYEHNKLKKATKLPKWGKELLASCPTSGHGVHKWLFTTALKLHPLFPDKEQLRSALAEATINCGREITERELDEAVYNSQLIAEGTGDENRGALRWPNRNGELIAEILSEGPSLAELEASSPVRWSDCLPHTEEIIDSLFRGNPLICGSPRKESSLTRPREEWRGFMDRQQFIVPNPMSSAYGMTQSGKRSMRSKANTGPRRFMVVEFDQGSFDDHAKLLVHLAKHGLLVLAVHSGNKSLHGWFNVAGQPEAKVEAFFGQAHGIGADPATWTICQYVRMPDGLRDGSKRQNVVYFSPKSIPTV